MQILREALLEKLNTPIILFKILRNKILCLTQYQLVLLNIDSGCKLAQIPYNGNNVWALQLSKDYIAILQRSGYLQIRRLDNIKEIVYKMQNIKIANSKYPKLKWWQDDLHLIYEKKYEEIKLLTKQLCTQAVPFQLSPKQTIQQLQFCDLLHGLKSIFFILNNSISMCLNEFRLGKLQFQGLQIKRVIRLCHPLQDNEYNKQYFAVLLESDSSINKQTYLKIYNILNMKLIFSKELIKQNDQQINIKCDDLCQYILVKYLKRKSYAIDSQHLMKINSQYYYSSGESKPEFEDCQPFILYDIQIGLKKDLQLFPSHSEYIKGKLYNSIDTCYYEKNQIFIASVVVEAAFKDQIYTKSKNIQHFNNSKGLNIEDEQSSLVIWKQIMEAKVNPKIYQEKIIKRIRVHNESLKQRSSSFGVEIGIEQQKILHDILSNLAKLNSFNQISSSNAYNALKKILNIQYFPMLLDVNQIQKDENKTVRQIFEKSNQDFLNTMSGFSSSQQFSPRSANSSNSHQQKQKCILKDIQSDLSRNRSTEYLSQTAEKQTNIKNKNFSFQNSFLDEQEHFCHECQQLKDYQNLSLIGQIIAQSSSKPKQSLQRIEASILKIDNLSRYRFQRIQNKSKKDKKTSQSIVSFIQNQFKTSLDSIKSKVLFQTDMFAQKLLKSPIITHKHQERAFQYQQNLIKRRQEFQKQNKIHKSNHDQLLDCLYDIEFPQVEQENYSNKNSVLDKNFYVDAQSKNISEEENKLKDEQLKMFSELLLKSFLS